jgi:malate dehydrogenase
LDDVICTADLAVGFKDADFVVFLGAFPRKDGMERKDLLDKNAGIFKTQGEALDKHAKRTVKSLVVGNPANTNCATLVAMAPGLPPHNFSALTRLDHNRATAQLAAKAGVGNGAVKNVTIWGNHSATQVPDISAATINGAPAKQIVTDHDWVKNGFISSVQQRGALIIKMRQLSSAASAAVAIADHLRDWHHGTAPGVHVSMAVPSDGSYGVPEGSRVFLPGGDRQRRRADRAEHRIRRRRASAHRNHEAGAARRTEDSVRRARHLAAQTLKMLW